MTHINEKSYRNFIFLKCWMFGFGFADPYRYGIQPKMLDPESMNPDPKQCLFYAKVPCPLLVSLLFFLTPFRACAID
jgi:hypothetical protein